MPVATLLTVVVAAIVAIAGAVVTITHPDALSFKEYVTTLTGIAGAGGLLGIGRGIIGLKDTGVVVPPSPAGANETPDAPQGGGVMPETEPTTPAPE